MSLLATIALAIGYMVLDKYGKSERKKRRKK